MKILVIDQDQHLRDALEVSLQLQWQDAVVLSAANGESGFALFLDEAPDVVLVDVRAPRMDGFEVLREIRRVSDTPVILMSQRGDDVDEVRGLEMGADDYVAKPFSLLAVAARIRAVLRRTEMPPPLHMLPDFSAGDLAIHFQNNEVTLNGEVVKLTPVEYRLLYHLARNAGHVISHQALLDRVWGPDQTAGREYLKVFVCRVRGKLRRPGSPDYIKTERGFGYRFVRPRELPEEVRTAEKPEHNGACRRDFQMARS
jgi:two-component system KDP operon response regulator KdpE